ncbi:helix-turn-helix transcriptional regulator [Nocardiopsis rhodophaea]|uniref:helix-turn-helix domain-containing protein n=1 Tax=Nocardiopsis rhodophaea TaxID=280238 RepID=UPI0031D35D9E
MPLDEDERIRRRYGNEVRRLRNDAGMTQDSLAHRVGCSKSLISAIERGEAPLKGDIRSKLDEKLGYGQLDRLWEDLTGNGRQAWLSEFSQLVREGASVFEYQMISFPGYLQTEEYAQAVIRNGVPWVTGDEVAAKATARAAETQRVVKAATPILWCVVDQTVLWRRFGSAAVMLGQLRFLEDLVQRGRLMLQMVRAASPTHPGNSGSFAVITGHPKPVVYAESIHYGQFITKMVDVEHYRLLFGRLQSEAEAVNETLKALQQEIKRLDDEQHVA